MLHPSPETLPSLQALEPELFFNLTADDAFALVLCSMRAQCRQQAGPVSVDTFGLGLDWVVH